jgi:hypothetical protein
VKGIVQGALPREAQTHQALTLTNQSSSLASHITLDYLEKNGYFDLPIQARPLLLASHLNPI